MSNDLEFRLLVGRLRRKMLMDAYMKTKPITKEWMTERARKHLLKNLDPSEGIGLGFEPELKVAFNALVKKLADDVWAQWSENDKRAVA